MNLWPLFVLARIRLSKQLSYDELHTQSNCNKPVRRVMGVERMSGFEEVHFPYQTTVDNVSLPDDASLQAINEVTVSFGHGEVFKKRGGNFIVKNGQLCSRE
jgi:hypothetical protein